MDDIKVERPGRVFSRGPLKNLELNRYKSKEHLYYPLDLDGGPYKHFLRFNINIPEKSQYKKGLSIISGDAGLSVADRNRAGGTAPNQVAPGTFISGSADPISGSLAAGIGALSGVISNFGNLAKALGTGSFAAGVGAAVGTGIDAGIVGATISFIDLQRKTKRLEQQICLYVPDTVQQTTANKWTGVSLTEALGAAGLAAQATQAGASANLEEMLSKEGLANKLSAGRNSEAGAIGGLTGEIAGKAAAASGAYGSGIERVMMASAGYAQNPQIEILFDSVDNRTFQFDFKFTPKSQNEAVMVLDIIKAFRYHAAPEVVEGAGGGRYFIPPSEFDIEYCFEGQPNKALHKFSTCVLEGIDVNYSNGNFATYDDGIPVEIGMTLRFMEVEILHKKLIADGY
jgi:hypothetical protein